ncbi:hypothetical protein ZWY2020_059836 [Hordeum vulgare]|nr:hypothetical protein ZWY2020_059836 [Hordeum vulgare]
MLLSFKGRSLRQRIKSRNIAAATHKCYMLAKYGPTHKQRHVESSPTTPANGKITQYLQRTRSLSPADGGTGTPASGKKGCQPRIDFSNQRPCLDTLTWLEDRKKFK